MNLKNYGDAENVTANLEEHKEIYKMSKLPQQLNKAFFAVAALFLVSCSNTKFVPQGDYLYTGASVKIMDDSLSKTQRNTLKKELEETLTPKPNATFLGLRPKLYIYNITSEPKKEKGFKYWLKYKVGEKPVYLSDVDIPFNLDLIENTGENRGYFNISASFDTLPKNKKVKIDYIVSPRTQYVINQVTFPVDSSVLAKEINQITDKTLLIANAPFNLDVIKNERERIDTCPKYNKVKIDYIVSPRKQYVINQVTFPVDSSVLAKEINQINDKTLLKANAPFNLDVIKKERERIDVTLKENGFYYFDPNNLIIQVDSTEIKHKVNLNVKVKENTPELARHQFTIDKVYIF